MSSVCSNCNTPNKKYVSYFLSLLMIDIHYLQIFDPASTSKFLGSKFLKHLWLWIPLSLFFSVEKSPHAHSDQLLHRESLLCGRFGHHHLPACQSCGWHHGDMVLREHTLQSCPLSSGKRSRGFVFFFAYFYHIICFVKRHICVYFEFLPALYLKILNSVSLCAHLKRRLIGGIFSS